MAKIEFISLVPKGANKLTAVYKSDGSFSVGALSKLDDEQGELLAVVYPANLRDSQGDIADASVVKQMAYDFVSNGAKIDLRHDNKALKPEQARVAETFLVQKTDERFHGWKDNDGNEVDLTGSWATVIKIDDKDLREKFRSGEWAGVSMGGTAVVEHEKAESSFDRLVDALSKAINPPARTTEPEEDDMTPEQLKELQKTMTDGFTAMTDTLTKALGGKAKSDDGDPSPKPVSKEARPPKFRGKLTDELAVRKHAIEVQLFNLEKELDWEDQESVEEFIEESEELRKELADIEKEQAEEKKNSRRAGPASRRSRESDSNSPRIAGLSKDDSDEFSVGLSLADAINKELYGDESKED